MPGGLRLAQRRAQRGRVVARDDDGVGLGLDGRLDRGNLRRGGVAVPLLTTTLPPSSCSAFWPPWSARTSYGFWVSFGMK